MKSLLIKQKPIGRWQRSFQKLSQKLFGSRTGFFDASADSRPVFESFREMEIIVFKVDFLGDFILAIPALTALKEKLKSEKIDIVVGEWNVGLAQKTGLFRNIYLYNGLARYDIDKRRLAEQERIIQEDLPTYDIAIELRRGKDSQNLMRWIKADCKIGTRSYKHAEQVLDICLDQMEDLHESLQMLRIVDAIPVRVLELPSLAERGDGGGTKTLSFFPFAGNSMKEWPLEKYVGLARELVEQNRIDQIHVFCSQAEQLKAADAFAECRQIRIFSGLPVDELVSILMQSSAVLSNDSFGAHLASYLRLPAVTLYSGQTRSLEWQPAFGQQTLLGAAASCTRCNKADAKSCEQTLLPLCLQQITVAEVFGELEKILSGDVVNDVPQNKLMPNKVMLIREGWRD